MKKNYVSVSFTHWHFRSRVFQATSSATAAQESSLSFPPLSAVWVVAEQSAFSSLQKLIGQDSLWDDPIGALWAAKNEPRSGRNGQILWRRVYGPDKDTEAEKVCCSFTNYISKIHMCKPYLTVENCDYENSKEI